MEQGKQEILDFKKIHKDHEQILLKSENYLENIQYQSNMLLLLINDLLDLAKFETMNFSFNETFFNMNELISQAYDTVKY